MKKVTIIGAIITITIIGAGIYLDLHPTQKTAQMKTSAPLNTYGTAPEFRGIEHWLNSDPITMKELKGKVVLVDFWTYSCINCIRTLPYVTGWYDKYKDNGFVVVGVHTPEFAFEKDTNNVQTALKRFGITYPVAQDNDYATWSAYNNRYWPAHYLIDQNGNVVYTHFGEGKYAETEQAIQQLLGLSNEQEMDEKVTNTSIQTPEIYLGLARNELMSNDTKPSQSTQHYSFPTSQKLNTFSVEGSWSFDDEYAKLTESSGKIRLRYSAQNVYMVAQSKTTATVTVLVDGAPVRKVDVKNSSLYTLFEGKNPGEHLLELQIQGNEFEAFTFTFG